jgi:O-antigen/teichoic acid export membrane protein
MLPAYMGGLSTTAIFDINSRMAIMISIPRNVIAAIAAPILAQAWNRNDRENIQDIYQKSSLNLLLIGCVLFLLIWCNLDFIYTIIPRHEIYEAGRWVVLMVGLSKIIDMGTGLNSEVLINSKYYRYDLIFYIILAVGLVVGNLILIPIYSYNGAALASLLALAGYNVLKFGFIWWKLDLQPFDVRSLGILIVSVLIYLVVSQIPVIEGSPLIAWLLNVGIRSAAIGGLFILAVTKFKLSPDISELVTNWFKK